MLPKIALPTLSFNDNLNYLVTQAQGLEMPKARVISNNLAGQHFGYFVSAYYGKRSFTLSGWIVGATISDYSDKRQALQSALNILTGEQAIVFTLPNGTELQINAICVNFDAPIEANVKNGGQFSASFQASFPFLVGVNEGTSNIFLPSGGGGTVPPPTMPMALGGNTGGSLSLSNGGNGIYYPTARIFGPVENPALRNDTLNKELRFDITLDAGEYLDIDFLNQTVTDNTGTNRYDTKSGDWWFINSGVNVIRFLADVYDPTAFVTFYYRDSYLGL